MESLIQRDLTRVVIQEQCYRPVAKLLRQTLDNFCPAPTRILKQPQETQSPQARHLELEPEQELDLGQHPNFRLLARRSVTKPPPSPTRE